MSKSTAPSGAPWRNFYGRRHGKTLRDSQSSLMSERNQLVEKTELARSRVEAMIEKLKAMENE